jgi:hypothetical protein
MPSRSRVEHLATNDIHFPAGDVEVNAVEEGGIVELVGETLKQVRVFQHVGNRVLGVPYKRHGRLGSERFDAAGEGLVGHVVFHDVHQRFVHSFLLSRELIEGHHIPVADQADLAIRIVDEEFRNADFATREQNAVR